MLKIMISIAGVFVLTLGAWALEGQVKNTASVYQESSFFLRTAAELREECKVRGHNHDSTAVKQGKNGEESAEAYKRGGREPFPAERLGIMLRVSGL